MAKVFISYSWEDRAIAKKIAEHLKQDGAETWIDFASIKGGQRFTERVNQALEWCDVLLLIWTKSSAASYYVGLEWQCALDLQKIIIPCLIDDTRRPAILRGFHYIDFKNFDDGYDQLFQALELTREQPPEPALISEQKALDEKPPEKKIPIKKAPPKTKQVKDMTLVFIPGGTYEMGDTFGDSDADEKPVHSVAVLDFYLGKTEVTNAQYAAFLNDYGKDTDDQGNTMIYKHNWGVKKVGNRWQPQSGYENHPVVYVTWYGAAQYAKSAGCRLPTQAEWEYAARSGGKKEKWAGTSLVSSLEDFAWYDKNSNKQTHPVAAKKVNALGLYDMTGNVSEWCMDWLDWNYYQNSPQNNPTGPASSQFENRVLRGGSWRDDERFCRATLHGGAYADITVITVGFRIVKDSQH